jgi:DNA-binding CsgD family transcriptional regulator
VSLLTAHHSVTSRRHSISTLLRVEVDGPFAEALRKYRGPWDCTSLEGFSPSTAWLRLPPDSRPPESDGRNNVERAVDCAERWRTRLMKAIHSAQSQAPHPSEPACVRFCSTLDTIMALLHKFSSLRPKHTHGANGRVALKAKGTSEPYCELCWRHTEYAAQGDARDADDNRPMVSRRFCNEHNQQRSPSIYRRDLKFKDRFTAERELLTWQGLARRKGPFVFLPDATCPSGMQMHLVPASAHEEDIRRAAYAMVHSGLQGTQAQCLALQAQGYNNPQIADRLAITVRAIRLAIATAYPRLEAAERIRWGGRSAPL